MDENRRTSKKFYLRISTWIILIFILVLYREYTGYQSLRSLTEEIDAQRFSSDNKEIRRAISDIWQSYHPDEAKILEELYRLRKMHTDPHILQIIDDVIENCKNNKSIHDENK